METTTQEQIYQRVDGGDNAGTLESHRQQIILERGSVGSFGPQVHSGFEAVKGPHIESLF